MSGHLADFCLEGLLGLATRSLLSTYEFEMSGGRFRCGLERQGGFWGTLGFATGSPLRTCEL